MKKKSEYSTFVWSGAIFLLCFALMLLAVNYEKEVIVTENITVPTISGSTNGVPGSAGLENIPEAVSVNSTGFPVLYFFLVAAVLSVAMYFIPVSKLRLLLRILFGFAFAWGTFIFLAIFLPPWAAGVLALGIGLAWLFIPRIWLHDALLIMTLVSLGSVFGALFSPWTVIVIMLVIAIYDYLSVRLGFMQWMAKKLSQSETLPAFFIPAKAGDWKTGIKGSELNSILEDKGEKQYSILGGGDIFFPLWLSAAVWFAAGITHTLIMGAFTLLGIAAVYVIHFYFMKGKPTPALPALFVSCLCGLLLVSFVL